LKTNAGTRKPTGPFTRVPVAAEIAARRYQFRRREPSIASARYPAKIAPNMKKASVMSKITCRARAKEEGVEATTMMANRAVSSSYSFRQNLKTIAKIPTAKSAEGKRAAHSDSPNTRKEIATALK